jgi:hypothetical protein
MYYTIKVTEAEYLDDYRILLTFNTGEQKEVDLKDHLNGEIFKPLRDKNIFMQFTVNKDLDTIVWSNGADIAPYSLYDIGKTISKTVHIKKKAKTSKALIDKI